MGRNKDQEKHKLKEIEETQQLNMIHRPCLDLNSNTLSIKQLQANQESGNTGWISDDIKEI